MFKKLLSSLTGKKDKPQASVEPEQVDSALTPPQEEMIVAYDANGQQMHITRSDWREKVFLPGLEQKWNSAAELYDAILGGLNDDFAADLIPAAARLVEIDLDLERSHTLQGIVLMQNGLLDEAESTLRAGMAKVGATGILLTNLAKVFAMRGDDTRADELLWQAIQADPNQENGLLWWATIRKEREGEAGYVAGLNTVAALPGAWRAQLWLARHYLEHKDVAAAKALYDEVLAGGRYDGSSLMMISGDLGRNGEIALLIELVAPVYDEHRHDPMAGINLLRAYQEQGDPEAGEKLLNRMYALDYPPLKQHLDEFSQAFQNMREQRAQGVPTDPGQVEISTLALSQPIWHYGLHQADWLFGQKPEDAEVVGFFALSKITDETKPAESQREDDVGRLTRAIPLYLAEAAHYWTDFATRCYFQVASGFGPVLTTHETDGNELFDLVPPGMKFFVTGQLGFTGEGEQRRWQLTLTLWDCTLRAKCAVESATVIQAELGARVLELEQRLLAKMGTVNRQPLDTFYARPPVEAMDIYLAELGQAFTLTMVASEYVPRSALWGERAMLEWPYNMALQWPQAEVPKLMYLSGLSKARDYQSEVLPEYKKRTLALLDTATGTDSSVEKLAPLVWKIFAMDEAFTASREQGYHQNGASYSAWLDRLAGK